jgi:hypothetical protein
VTRQGPKFSTYVDAKTPDVLIEAGMRGLLAYKTQIAKRDTDGGSENYFNGKISDMRIYNRALPPTTIALDYTLGPGGWAALKNDKIIFTTKTIGSVMLRSQTGHLQPITNRSQ